MPDTDYYHYERRDIQSALPERLGHVLDVGCAAGRLGKALKEKGAASVTGIEIDPEAAKEAGAVLDTVIRGDIETIELPFPDFPDNHFDTIICADVLEHLRDPWAVARRLAALLKPDDGTFAACLPNAAYYQILLNLLAGGWPYSDSGILDRTHLRFFTRWSGAELLTGAGLKVNKIIPLVSEPDRELAARAGLDKIKFEARKLFKMFGREISAEEYKMLDAGQYFVWQYIYLASKPTA